MGTLYIVPTPIGNLSDISSRAIATLKEVSFVVAEDTRVTRKLLSAFDIRTKIQSLNAHSNRLAVHKVVAKLEFGDGAYVCDAGTPSISDPGAALVKIAWESNFRVVPIPGPSAPIVALSVSGFSADRFEFSGFLPRTTAKKRRELTRLLQSGQTCVMFESPHRVASTLAMLAELDSIRLICICRELSKLHEQVLRGTAQQVLAELKVLKGEFSIVIGGVKERHAAPA